MMRPIVSASLALCAAVLTSGCPQPIVDESPGDLTAEITVLDTDPTPSDNKVLFTIQFGGGRLDPAITVSVNGTAVPYNALGGYIGRVPKAAIGATYTVEYTKDGTSTRVATLVVPQRPVFSALTSGAAIFRSAGFSFAYVPGSGLHMHGRATSSANVSDGTDQPDDGSYDLNTAGLDVGSGRLYLTRVLALSPGTTELRTVTVEYQTGNDILVDWR